MSIWKDIFQSFEVLKSNFLSTLWCSKIALSISKLYLKLTSHQETKTLTITIIATSGNFKQLLLLFLIMIVAWSCLKLLEVVIIYERRKIAEVWSSWRVCCAIEYDCPKDIESAYDAAMDWATVYEFNNSTKVIVELSTLNPIDIKRITISKESDTDSVDQLDAIDMQQVKYYNCSKHRHFARDCKAKWNGFSTTKSQRNLSHWSQPNSSNWMRSSLCGNIQIVSSLTLTMFQTKFQIEHIVFTHWMKTIVRTSCK